MIRERTDNLQKACEDFGGFPPDVIIQSFGLFRHKETGMDVILTQDIYYVLDDIHYTLIYIVICEKCFNLDVKCNHMNGSKSWIDVDTGIKDLLDSGYLYQLVYNSSDECTYFDESGGRRKCRLSRD